MRVAAKQKTLHGVSQGHASKRPELTGRPYQGQHTVSKTTHIGRKTHKAPFAIDRPVHHTMPHRAHYKWAIMGHTYTHIHTTSDWNTGLTFSWLLLTSLAEGTSKKQIYTEHKTQTLPARATA